MDLPALLHDVRREVRELRAEGAAREAELRPAVIGGWCVAEI